MKIRVIHFAIALFVVGVCGSSALAQTRKDSAQVSREMFLEKEFDPIFRDASKINSLPTVADPEVVKSSIEYSNYSIQVTPKLQIPILLASTPSDTRVKGENGFVRLGIGNYLNILGQLDWSIVSTPKDLLHLGINHYSTDGKVKLLDDTKSKMTFNNERFTLGYKHMFSNLEFNIQAGYLMRGFNYYGEKLYNPYSTMWRGDNWEQNQQGADFGMGIVSIPKEKGFNYSLNIAYEYFGNKYDAYKGNGFKENKVRTDFNLYSLFLNKNKVGVRGYMSNYFYSNVKNANAYYSKNDLNNYTLITLNPYYDIIKDNYFFHLGLLGNYSLNKENKLFVAPDLEGQVKFIDQLLLYAFVKGHVNENSLERISRENLYISPNIRIQDSRTQIDSELGFKINPFAGFFIQPLVGFKMTDNEHFYVNNLFRSYTGSELYPLYTDLKQVKVGGTIQYQYQKLIDLRLSIIKNNYSCSSSQDVKTDHSANIDFKASQARHLPEMEFDFKISSQVTPALKLDLGYYLGSGRKSILFNLNNNLAQSVDMEDISELNFGATYLIVKNFSVWLEINNILNKQYEIYQGYTAQGIHFMVGASYIF